LNVLVVSIASLVTVAVKALASDKTVLV